MLLNEKEKAILNYFRNPLIYVTGQNSGKLTIHDVDVDELMALYDKMDRYIEIEGQQRRELGSYDEMYVLELLNAKDRIKNEIERKVRKTQ